MPRDSSYMLLNEEDDQIPKDGCRLSFTALAACHEADPREIFSDSRDYWPNGCTTYLILGTAVASLLLSVANLAYLHSLSLRGSPKTRSSDRLEIVSQYIGLDRAIRRPSSPSLSPMLSYPFLMARINASEPNKAVKDSRRWDSSFGMIYLQERQFIVSPEVSTIIQFRTGDFSFENCTLSVTIPPSPDPSMPESAQLLDVWRLGVTDVLSADALTWNSRPRQDVRVARWSLREGYHFESDYFHCPWGSIHTFEFMAADKNSSLRFLQDPTEYGTGEAFNVVRRELADPDWK